MVLLIVLLGFYYMWYRYPFQVSSSVTSPTYSDTPAWIALGKYLLLAVILALAAFWRSLGPPVRLPRPPVLMAYLFLLIVPVVAGLAVERPELVESGVFFAVPLFLFTFTGWRVSVQRLDRLLVWAVYLGLAVEALQIALFLAVGRLPALAFKDSIMVRFGSFLDDPNGWAIIGTWLFFFTVHRWGGWKRVLLAGGLVLTIVLTQSLTGLAIFVLASCLFGTVLIFSRAATFFRAMVTVLVALTLVGAVVVRFSSEIVMAYSLFMATKRGSIQGHAGVFDVLTLVTPLGLLGVHPSETAWGESAYVNALVNLGLVYVVAFVWVGVSAMVYYFRLFRRPGASTELRAFAAGALAMLVAVYFGSLNLPYMEVYPVNLFAALLLGLASAGLLPDVAREPGERRMPGARRGDGLAAAS